MVHDWTLSLGDLLSVIDYFTPAADRSEEVRHDENGEGERESRRERERESRRERLPGLIDWKK